MAASLKKPPQPGRISLGLRETLLARPATAFPLRELFEHLAGRGHAALMVVMGLLTWLPAVSVVIGPILVFVGLRFSFGQRPWLPSWLLEREIKRTTIETMADRCAAVERRVSKVLRPRYTALVRNVWMHRLLGLTIAACGALLPLPIPFTNIPLALPVLVIGFSLLEDDGLYASLGFALAAVVLGSLAAATWFGGVGLEHLWHRYFGDGPPPE